MFNREGTIRSFIVSEVQRLSGEGRTLDQMAETLGVSKRTFINWAKDPDIAEARLTSSRYVTTQSKKGGDKSYEVIRMRIDLTGRRFGKLVVRERASVTNTNRLQQWLCDCDCGGERVVRSDKLGTVKGAITSCLDCLDDTQKRAIKARNNRKGGVWAFKSFASNWQDRLAKLTPLQEYLFEVICDGRTNHASDQWNDYESEPGVFKHFDLVRKTWSNGSQSWVMEEFETTEPFEDWCDNQVQMEALEIVLLCKTEDDIKTELATFGIDRLQRAAKRLRINQ